MPTDSALPQGDGTYRLHGQKIFITYGEHDLAENIVHLVLARTPDAPEGGKGISLFEAVALELARLPQGVRGFGHVKARNQTAADARQSRLLAEFAQPSASASDPRAAA